MRTRGPYRSHAKNAAPSRRHVPREAIQSALVLQNGDRLKRPRTIARGRLSRTCPLSVVNGFEDVALRLLPLPRPAGSYGSQPKRPVISTSRSVRKTSRTIALSKPPSPVNSTPSARARATSCSAHAHSACVHQPGGIPTGLIVAVVVPWFCEAFGGVRSSPRSAGRSSSFPTGGCCWAVTHGRTVL